MSASIAQDFTSTSTITCYFVMVIVYILRDSHFTVCLPYFICLLLCFEEICGCRTEPVDSL